jgi:hypothetical protein
VKLEDDETAIVAGTVTFFEGILAGLLVVLSTLNKFADGDGTLA